MHVSTSLLLAIVEELRREGVALEDLCAKAGLASTDLRAMDLRVPIETYDRVVRAAQALQCTPGLGLRVGASAPAGALNVVGYVLATSATIREAFTGFLEYSALIKDGAHWQIFEEGDTARFVYDHPAIAVDNARFDAETCLSLVLKIGQQFLAGESPQRVGFRHACPGYAEEYARVFGCDVRFDEPSNELVFARVLLDRAQAHHDERLRALLAERATELLRRLGSQGSFLSHVEDLVRLEAEAGTPRASRLAERLGLSVRTFERQIRDQGVSLQSLIDVARKDASCAALRRSEGSIKRVAYRLGFSEPSAFHRAFKRWTGMTPARYRATAASCSDSGERH